MGDHLVTIDMRWKLGRGDCAPFWGELGPHLTQCRLGIGLPVYQVASWSIQPFGHKRHGLKLGACAPIGRGELGPHLAQCRRGRGVPPCQVSSWSIQMFDHNIPTSQTDRIGQTDNGPIAKGEPFYKRSPNKSNIVLLYYYFRWIVDEFS